MAPEPYRRQRLLATIILAAALAILVYFLAEVWSFTVDDTFITLRYARNVAHGSGLTFNPEDPPVEGYTTFLWMVLMIIPHLLTVDAVLFAKLAGLLCTLGTLYVVYQLVSVGTIGRRLFPGIGGAFAVLLLCANPATAVHTVSGMETPLFVFLFAVCSFYAARWVGDGSSRDATGLSITCLLLGLTRPEGNLIAVAVLGSSIWISPIGGRRRLIASITKWYLLPGVLYFVLRAWYFGMLLPLPFYVKVASAKLFNGFWTTWSYVRFLLIPLSIPAIIGLRRGSRVLLPGVVAGALLVVFFVFPRHIMGYEWRYLFPASVPASVLAARGLFRLVENASPRRVLRIATACGLLLIALGGPLLWAKWIINDKQKYASGLEAAHVALGNRLARIRDQAPTSTVVIGDAGAVSYYSDWRVIDLQGLNDPHLARARFDIPYIMAQQPDVLVLVSIYPDRFVAAFYADEGVFENAMTAGYERVAVARFTATYYLWLMAPQNSPVRELIRRS